MRTPLALFLLASLVGSAARADDRPNIVWIVVDDMSANFSCYGETAVRTPHVDRLAKEGTRFARAFTTAPVCSPCRSAFITGCYQTTIGAHHHRSGRGEKKITLPEGVIPVPKLFQAAGYYTCIGGPMVKGKALGKTDYNFEWDPSMYDGNDWSKRKPGQPFFMQVQLHGGKYRGNAPSPAWHKRVTRELGSRTTREQVKLPPYYPDDPAILDDWADYLDCVRYTDKEVGDVVTRLEKEGILDKTVIVFITDHGISHARGKQFLYDEGIHIPFIVRGPGVKSGVVRNDLIEHIDIAATSLALAGIPIPKAMQSRDVLAGDYKPRTAVFSARDRCDETMENLRSIRTDRYKYIRNGMPDRPMLQPNAYKDSKTIVKALLALHASGKLPPLTERLLFAPRRPPEELYDLQSDPFELTNLAADPSLADTLASLRIQLNEWQTRTNDQGRHPEPAAMYDSDMAVYLKEGAAGKNAELIRNINLNRTWAAQGKSP